MEQTTCVRLCGFPFSIDRSIDCFCSLFFLTLYLTFCSPSRSYLAIRNSNHVQTFLPRNHPKPNIKILFGISGAHKIDYKGRCSAWTIFIHLTLCVYHTEMILIEKAKPKGEYFLDWFSPYMIDWLIFLCRWWFFSLTFVHFSRWYSLLFGYIFFFSSSKYWDIKLKNHNEKRTKRDSMQWQWHWWMHMKYTHKRPFVFVLSYFINVNVLQQQQQYSCPP